MWSVNTASKYLGIAASLSLLLLPGLAALLLSAQPAIAQGNTSPAQRSFWGMILWPVLGLAAGLLGRFALNKIRETALLDIILGIVGACIFGAVAEYFGPRSGGFEAWPMAAAFFGGLATVAVYHGAAKDESGR
jgi:uncharacterized membrane protein YeaQ/YmgE (transglycosylase-associated protein family)